MGCFGGDSHFFAFCSDTRCSSRHWCQVVQQSIFQKVKDYWGEDDDEATGFCLKPGRSWKCVCVCVCLLLGNKYVLWLLILLFLKLFFVYAFKLYFSWKWMWAASWCIYIWYIGASKGWKHIASYRWCCVFVLYFPGFWLRYLLGGCYTMLDPEWTPTKILEKQKHNIYIYICIYIYNAMILFLWSTKWPRSVWQLSIVVVGGVEYVWLFIPLQILAIAHHVSSPYQWGWNSQLPTN